MRLRIITILLAAAVCIPAAAQEDEAGMADKLTLQVAEIIFYVSDVEQALEHYRDTLGWKVHFHAPGGLAILDVDGAYQLAVVSAKWTEGWEEGQAVPPPQLSFESKDLAADRELLLARGVECGEIGGDPGSMLTLGFKDPSGNELFIWQDTQSNVATGVEHLPAPPEGSPYNLGESLLFCTDVAAAEAFYTGKLGLSEAYRHGNVFVGLNRDGGRIVGLYHWPRWWDKPADGSVPGTMRLSLEARDIRAEHQRLVEAGADPAELVEENDGLKWFHVADPDGNLTLVWEFIPSA